MMASQKAKKSDDRKAIADQGIKLMDELNSNDAWQDLDDSEQKRLKMIAKECAQVFQRSSSCIEGRNGHLSLRHHALHHLSDRKLGTLTVIHNYFIKRPDGTTAAERFFGAKPKDLFENLKGKMPSAPRPAQKRINLKRAA